MFIKTEITEIKVSNLNGEHYSGRNLHVMSELEIRHKGECLNHTDVTVNLEAHVGHRAAGVRIPNDVFRDDVQP